MVKFSTALGLVLVIGFLLLGGASLTKNAIAEAKTTKEKASVKIPGLFAKTKEQIDKTKEALK